MWANTLTQPRLAWSLAHSFTVLLPKKWNEDSLHKRTRQLSRCGLQANLPCLVNWQTETVITGWNLQLLLQVINCHSKSGIMRSWNQFANESISESLRFSALYLALKCQQLQLRSPRSCPSFVMEYSWLYNSSWFTQEPFANKYTKYY